MLNSKMNPLSSSPSTLIGNNVDIFAQILLCLPVEPLLVFKTVSKQWLSVISDPIFVKEHIQKQHLKSLVVETSRKPIFVPLDGSPSYSPPFETLYFIPDSHLKIMQSCSGLLLCSSYKGNMFNCTYYICNPSTKQYRQIVCGFDRAKVNGFFLVKSVGLVYDPVNYQVYCVWSTKPTKVSASGYQIEKYSSETDSWKLSGDVFSNLSCNFDTSGVFWNGSLHWIDSRVFENHICFNVDQELVTPMPPYRHLLHSKDIAKLVYFGESRGRLHLISDYDRLSVFDILEMKTDYKGWIPIFRIDVRRCFPYPVVYGGYCVLHVEEVGDSIRLVVRIQEQAISCDIPGSSFKDLPEFAPWLPRSSFKDLYEFAPGTWKKISYDRSHQYIETLASV